MTIYNTILYNYIMKQGKDRLLNSDEINRVLISERVKKKYISLGYSIEEIVDSKLKIFIISFLISVCSIGISIYLYINNNEINYDQLLKPKYIIILIVSILVLSILHSLIKYLFYGLICKEHFESAELYFDNNIIPHSTFLQELNKLEYIISLLLPIIILGIIPIYVTIKLNMLFVFIISLFGLILCSYDLYLLVKAIFTGNKYTTFLNHPTEYGLIIMKKNM